MPTICLFLLGDFIKNCFVTTCKVFVSDITIESILVKIVSMINLKGGVGKTTMTVAFAEYLALQHQKKVLVIDLDPQTNATVSLIKEKTWDEKDGQGETLFQLFKDKLDKTSKFQLDKTIVKKVSNIDGGIKNLDLLPSSLRLVDLQDSLSTISGPFYITSPITILKNSVSNILENYDVVLIDCPPNLGIITLNGLLISDYYLIPCIPDLLSTYGIPQILSRVKAFSDASNHKITPLGIVISMYRKQTNIHKTTIEKIKIKSSSKVYPHIFDTFIPLATKASEAMDIESTPNTLKQKYGYAGLDDKYDALVQEFLRCL